MSKRGTAVLFGIAGVAIVGSLALLAPHGVAALRRGGPAVPTFTVTRGDFVRQVRAEGILVAAQSTLISGPLQIRGGLKIAWLASDGSRVEQGDVVVRFDSTDLERELREGQRSRAAAQGRIRQKQAIDVGMIRNLGRDAEQAKLELRYAREFQSKDPEIFSRMEIIEAEIDEQLAVEHTANAERLRTIRQELSQVQLDLLGIKREQAELQITEAEMGLQQLEVLAPHEGIFVLMDTGNGVPAVGQTIWGGNPLAEIPNLDEMVARVYVLEADSGGLAAGLSATVRLEAHPQEVQLATVLSVDALAMPRSMFVPVQYFGVTLKLEHTDPRIMKPGQRVVADLVLGESPDALTVPRQAVFEAETGWIVYVARGSSFEPAPVKLGPAGLGRVEIAGGLSEGDVVALADPYQRSRKEKEADEPEGVPGLPNGVGP